MKIVAVENKDETVKLLLVQEGEQVVLKGRLGTREIYLMRFYPNGYFSRCPSSISIGLSQDKEGKIREIIK